MRAVPSRTMAQERAVSVRKASIESEGGRVALHVVLTAQIGEGEGGGGRMGRIQGTNEEMGQPSASIVSRTHSTG